MGMVHVRHRGTLQQPRAAGISWRKGYGQLKKGLSVEIEKLSNGNGGVQSANSCGCKGEGWDAKQLEGCCESGVARGHS